MTIRELTPHFHRPRGLAALGALARLLLVCALPGVAFAPAAGASDTGAIAGVVLAQSTNQPIAGASVRLKGIPGGAATDTAGAFTFRELPAGVYTVVITCLGYQQHTVSDVAVTAGATARVAAALADNVITIGAFTTTARRVVPSSHPVSTYAFSREEIFRNPGAQGDIFRAIGILPGVSSGGAQYSAIAVRGQGTSDNVYLVDDIPMFELSHLGIEGYAGGFDDPNGGRFSVFAPRVIDRAQFEAGGFAAQYGRRSSSVLSLGIAEGDRDSSTTSGQFDLLGATLIHEGPLRPLGRTSVFASARYQNFSAVERLVGLTSAGAPEYGDYLVKTTTMLGARQQLSLVAMVAPEGFRRTAEDVTNGGNVNANNHPPFIGASSANKSIVGANLRTITGPASFLRNVLYFRTSTVNNALGIAWPAVNPYGDVVPPGLIRAESDLRRVKDDQSELGFRSLYTQGWRNGSVTGGFDLARVALDYQRTLKHPDTLYTFTATDPRPDPTQDYVVVQPDQFDATFKQFAFDASAYLDLSVMLFDRLTLNPGVRYDHTGFTRANTVAPRLSGSLALNDRQSVNFAAGLFYQDPNYSDIAGEPAGTRLQSERVAQYVLGVSDHPASDLRFTAEGWYKRLDRMLVRPEDGASLLLNRGTGDAYGADVNLIKNLSTSYYGQIAYSYMSSRRDDHDGLGTYDFTFSQPHTISLLASYKPDERWVTSAKFRYATGRPRDRYRIYSNVLGDPADPRYAAEIVGRNADRAADFVSLDVRADYRVQRGAARITAFVDVVDALNRFNQNSATLEPLTGRLTYLGLGVFPTFGVRVEF